jgi:hypothetical protein
MEIFRGKFPENFWKISKYFPVNEKSENIFLEKQQKSLDSMSD